MAAEQGVKVMNLRKFAGRGGAVAFFNIHIPAVGAVLTEWVLKQWSSGEFSVSAPAKPRKVRGSDEIQKDENGRDIWDAYVKPYFERAEASERGKPTAAYLAFEQLVLAQAVAQFNGEQAANRGRGPAAATGASATVDAQASTGDLPF